VIDENGSPLGPGDARDSQYRDFLRTDGSILLSSTMTRKALIEEVGGFSSLFPLGQDLDLIYRIAREGAVSFLPEVLVEYRRHSTNSWLNTSSSKGQEVKLILTQHLVAAESRGETENVESARIGMKYVLPVRAVFAIYRARRALSSHDLVGVFVALAQAFRVAPIVTLRVVLRAAKREMVERGSRTKS
jgi:hypothetical protein